MSDWTVTTHGLQELIAAADLAGKKTARFVRNEIRETAVPVRDEARRLFTKGVAASPSIQLTADNFRIYVRRVGVVSVEQRLTKTTGLRPDFGRLQMRRALIPALEEKQTEVTALFAEAVDHIAKTTIGGTLSV